jgi:hypothetical protein
MTLLITAVWLATRPYVGVIHDSRFYTVQALNALLPGRFAQDLYFLYGSQDEFTIFGLAYQPLLASLGIAKAALLLTIAGQCAWVGGLTYFAGGLFGDRRTTLVAVLLAVALPGGVLLNYGEQFLTPRLFAESLTLWALGSMQRGKQLRALVILGLSVFIHPIMTLPGLATLFLYNAARRRIWWLAAAFAIVVSLGLAYWNVQPFARLLVSFDPAWLAIVRERDFFSFLAKWTASEWLKTCNVFALAVLGLWVARPRERFLFLVILLVAVGGLALTLIGGDLLHNVLLTDAQQYRATWLLAVVANLLVAPLLLNIRWRVTSPLIIVALVAAGVLLVVTQFIGAGGYFFATPAVASAGLLIVLDRSRDRPFPTMTRVVCWCLLITWCGISFGVVYEYLAWIENLRPGHGWQMTFGAALTLAALAAGANYFRDAHGGSVTTASHLAMLATVLVALSLARWDQRTGWTKFIEATTAPPASLTSLLPDDGPIYWEGDVRVPWFVLRRPSYFSCGQGTGAMFFRGTAVTYAHRRNSFLVMPTLDFGEEQSCPSLNGQQPASFSREKLASVCDSEPGLGVIVLTRPVLGVVGNTWISPAEFEEVRQIDGEQRLLKTDHFFIYSCSEFRWLKRSANDLFATGSGSLGWLTS